MNKQDFFEWFELLTQYKKGENMEYFNYREFIRLNHLVMEATYEIHNKNMMNDLYL